ncbi:unnamed protein product [Fraxinus pennsylvanica]|uniref:Uncharacterized protein n=1 Tax=Fraxinus pennsylvanica TaxID=56036 RepID=A0AAD1ZAY9_9LAMI|nr:unnamed protein product [Fraxinus pennsylvanica]
MYYSFDNALGFSKGFYSASVTFHFIHSSIRSSSSASHSTYTEMVTWHCQSSVWLVTPVVYEASRLLQLTRGLKLGVELGTPLWTVLTIKGLGMWMGACSWNAAHEGRLVHWFY